VILNKGKLAAQGEISKLKEIRDLYEIKIKGEAEGFLQGLRNIKCRVEKMEEGLLKVYLPPNQDKQEIFRIAAEKNVQMRHFVKSESSLEDLFAKVVGVD